MRKVILILLVFGLWCTEISLAQNIPLHIVRGNGNYPPNEVGLEPNLSGVHIEIVEKVAAKLNFQIRWESLPWTRALRKVRQGDADAITFVSKSPEREQDLLFLEGNALSETNHMFVILKKNQHKIRYSGKLQSMQGYGTILIQRGYNYGTLFNQADFLVKYPVKETEDILRFLLVQEYQIGVVNRNEAAPLAREMGVYQEFVFLQPSVVRLDNYIAFSKKRNHEKLARQFAKVILQIRNKQLPVK